MPSEIDLARPFRSLTSLFACWCSFCLSNSACIRFLNRSIVTNVVLDTIRLKKFIKLENDERKSIKADKHTTSFLRPHSTTERRREQDKSRPSRRRGRGERSGNHHQRRSKRNRRPCISGTRAVSRNGCASECH